MLTLSLYIFQKTNNLNTLFICYSYYILDRARYILQGDHGNGILIATLEATKDAVNFQRQKKPFLTSKTIKKITTDIQYGGQLNFVL